jgi:hypothetical protein
MPYLGLRVMYSRLTIDWKTGKNCTVKVSGYLCDTGHRKWQGGAQGGGRRGRDMNGDPGCWLVVSQHNIDSKTAK